MPQKPKINLRKNKKTMVLCKSKAINKQICVQYAGSAEIENRFNLKKEIFSWASNYFNLFYEK